MKISLNNYYLIVIAALIFTILAMRACSPSSNPSTPPIPTVKIDTVWLKGKDSIVYKPKIVKIIYRDTIPKNIDTTLIIKNYFSKIIHQDTIKIDTLGYVLIRDTITENRVQNRTNIISYKLPVITKTINNCISPPHINQPRNQFYIGFDIFGNQKQIVNYFGPSLTLKTKKDKRYGAGIGLTPNGVGVRVSTSWKIKIKPN